MHRLEDHSPNGALRGILLAALPLLLFACGGPPEEGSQAGPGPTASPAVAPTVPIAGAGESPSDPFGYYFLTSDEPLPEWAAALDHLHLSTIEMKGEEMVTVPLYGFLRPRSGDDYHLVNLTQEGAHLAFATEELNGVSFAFDGRFLKAGSFPMEPPEGVVLTGLLRRLQGGRVTDELKADFTYTAGD
jgi:hypothetical protein